MFCFATTSKQRAVLWFPVAMALALFAGTASATVITMGSTGGLASSAAFTPDIFPLPPFSTAMNPIEIGFALDLYGKQFTKLNINNDGTVSLTNGSGDNAGPYGFMANPALSSSAITQSQGKYHEGGNDYSALEVNWPGYSTCGTNNDLTNMFQLLLVNRSKDTQHLGDFDVQFNYNLQCLTNLTSVGVDYLPTGTVNGFTSTYYSVLQSGQAQLLNTDQLSGISGGILFQVRSDPPPTDPVPEPATVALIGAGLFSLAWLRRRPAVPASGARP